MSLSRMIFGIILYLVIDGHSGSHEVAERRLGESLLVHRLCVSVCLSVGNVLASTCTY